MRTDKLQKLAERLSEGDHWMQRKSDGQLIMIWKSKVYPNYSAFFDNGKATYRVSEIPL